MQRTSNPRLKDIKADEFWIKSKTEVINQSNSEIADLYYFSFKELYFYEVYQITRANEIHTPTDEKKFINIVIR